jgi:hypothetical protein
MPCLPIGWISILALFLDATLRKGRRIMHDFVMIFLCSEGFEIIKSRWHRFKWSIFIFSRSIFGFAEIKLNVFLFIENISQVAIKDRKGIENDDFFMLSKKSTNI